MLDQISSIIHILPGADLLKVDGVIVHEPTRAFFDKLPKTEAEFLAIDLDTLSSIPAEQLESLKGVQCDLIKAKRAEAYKAAGITPEEYLNIIFDKTSTVEAFEAKRATVKATVAPWPGSYRGSK